MMAPDYATVILARINRRERQDTPLSGERSSFSADLMQLVDRRLTRAVQVEKDGSKKTWYAADFDVTPDGRFLLGTLGYSELRTDRQFDDFSWSWVKGEEERRDTGSDGTVVPFAIDLDDAGRWVAFATATRMKKNQFRAGLQRVLQQAVLQADILGFEWEVDLITRTEEVRSWLEEHPLVFEMVRTIKFSNPGTELDEDEDEMRALAARRKTETFRAPPRGKLNVASDTFQEKIEGVESGFVELRLRARGASRGADVTFNSKEHADSARVPATTLSELAQNVLGFLATKVPYLGESRNDQR